MKKRFIAGVMAGGMLVTLLPGTVSAGPPCTITGTPVNDVFDDGPYGPGAVICGRGGRDRVNRLSGAIFRGGTGRDRVGVMTDGKFRGGRHSDRVGWLQGGAFLGGRGHDGSIP